MGRKSKSIQNRYGFTLVELVITIAIVVTLAGIALPAVNYARMHAQMVVCQTKLRTQLIATIQYTEDHKGIWPTARFIPEPFIAASIESPLADLLDKYVDASLGDPLYECPRDGGYVFDRCGTSYFYVPLLNGSTLVDNPVLNFTQWAEADIPVVGDFDNGLFYSNEGVLDVPAFHVKRNIGFSDGHVGHFRVEKRYEGELP